VISIIHELRATSSKLAKASILKKHSANGYWLVYLKSVYSPFVLYGKSGDKNNNQDDLDNLKLCRSINAGVSALSINKAYPGLIPTASKINKAYNYGKKPKPLTFPLYAAIKYDGNYVNIIVNDEGPKFFTSGGHEYTHENHCMDLRPGYVYMAERIHGIG